ncbi:unnamed protein product [Sphagnum balticum]
MVETQSSSRFWIRILRTPAFSGRILGAMSPLITEQNKFMHKQPAAHTVATDLLLQVGKRRRINVSQAEVSRLYDKNKNSYSKKFKMKLQLLNEPHRSMNRSLENTISKSKKLGGTGTPKSRSRESLQG